jgi:probable F420-dependent oxidoreductase
MMTLDASTDLRALLGPVGTWSNFDGIGIADVLDRARAFEDLGFGTLWVNESVGREPFSLLGALAGATGRITLGLGIASTYARDAVAAHCGARTIADLTGGRFVMGLGISHRSSAGARGHDYAPPLATMTAYLDAYEDAPWSGPAVDDPPLVLAALGPRMLGLAATRTAGAFP